MGDGECGRGLAGRGQQEHSPALWKAREARGLGVLGAATCRMQSKAAPQCQEGEGAKEAGAGSAGHTGAVQ